MTSLPILTAGQKRDIVLDGTRYTVRALSHGEHGALQLALAGVPMPSTELINDEMRQIAEAEGRADLADALIAEEEAGDALSVYTAGSPPDTDAEGLRRWLEEHAEDLRRLRAVVLSARRKARLARERYRTHPSLAPLTARVSDAAEAHVQMVVAAGLSAIDGAACALTREQVAQLPSSHVTALSEAVSALLSPSRDAAKN
jgi:hypothetical protein